MIRFVIDAQLPPGLAIHLRERGHLAEHVNRVGLGAAGDIAIWEYTRRNRATLITKDEDFVALARREPSGPQVVWIRLGNCRKAALLQAFSKVLPELRDLLAAGDAVVEIR